MIYVKFQYIVSQLPERGANSSSIEPLSLLVFEEPNDCCLEAITPDGKNSHICNLILRDVLRRPTFVVSENDNLFVLQQFVNH